MSDATTLPGLLDEQAARSPGRVAIRHKRLGVWREVAFADYAQAVHEVALALDEEGIGAGDAVAVVADSQPAWLYADLGIQASGAWSVGVYPSVEPHELAAALAAARVRIVFAGDQEQVDKLLERRQELPELDRIVVFDPQGLHTPEYAEARVEDLDALRARGRAALARRPQRYAELLAARSADDVALVAFSAGTSGSPRGALLRHGGEVAIARLLSERLCLRPGDRAFSLLPLAHAAARLADAYAPLVVGSSVSFAEAPETAMRDIVEVAPTILLCTSRLLTWLRGEVELRVARGHGLRPAAYRLAMRLMERGGAGRAVGRALVGRFVVAKAGFRRLRYCGITGSFVPPELTAWFSALGVPVREQYGQVETGGVVSTGLSEEDSGTTGRPLGDAIEVRTDEAGELLVRTPGLLAGLLTGEAPALEDGWYRTGDTARIDGEGRIVPLAKRDHVVRTEAGEEASPAELEARLVLSPYVSAAIIIAADRPFVAALLELDHDAVAEWARRAGIAVGANDALAAHEQVVELLEGEVRAACERLPEGQKVAAFRILPRPLAEELTPTGKVRRGVVEERFAALIDDIYSAARTVAQTTAM